jgi:hypothetical protein
VADAPTAAADGLSVVEQQQQQQHGQRRHTPSPWVLSAGPPSPAAPKSMLHCGLWPKSPTHRCPYKT